MEYLRPVRLVLKGDREKAHSHVRDARRLIARLLARSGGVVSARDHMQLTDGTTVEVVVAGNDITAIITSPGGTEQTRWFEDFVVHPGLSGFDGGEMTTYPIILKYAPRTPNNWVPYFWKGDSPGYGAAPRPKGTYSAAFPRPRGGSQTAHLDGLGLTHINTRGEAVNYRGLPNNPYIWQAYRQPYNYYDLLVNHLGYVLLDTYQYEIDSNITLPAHYVMGAALHEGYLYAVLGEFVDGVSYPPPDPVPAAYGDVWVSPMYPDYQTTQMLVRFKLSLTRDVATGLLRYKIGPNSHEVLWQSSLVRTLSPWTFSADASVAVNYTLPEEPHITFRAGVQETFLSTTHDRLQLTIDRELGTASLSSASATTAIAEDDGVVLHLEHDEDGRWNYRLDSHTIVACEWGAPTAPYFTAWQRGEVRGKQRTIVFANLRTRIIVFLETEYLFVTQSQRERHRRLILWSNGTEEVLQESTFTGPSGDALIWAMGLLVIRDTLSQPASGLAMYFARFSGYLTWENDNPSELLAYFITDCWAPLGHQDPLTETGTSFGGCAVANHWVGQGTPPPLAWTLTGYDGANNPRATSPPRPEVYRTPTGGCAIATDPPRLCFGTRIMPNQHYNQPGSTVNFNYITDGDLPTLTGNVLTEPEFAISVTILGRPPKGQTVEY